MRLRLLLAIAFLSTAAPSLATAEPRPHAERLAEVHGVPYAARVADGLYRGGQPDATGLAWLKTLGVRTIVDLRNNRHAADEARQAAALGFRYEQIPLDPSDPPTAAAVARFLALVTDPALRPIYVHCRHGVDRTGALMAVYRMEIDGWSNTDAFAEMVAFGAHRLWLDLRKFVRTYAPEGRWRTASR